MSPVNASDTLRVVGGGDVAEPEITVADGVVAGVVMAVNLVVVDVVVVSAVVVLGSEAERPTFVVIDSFMRA
jgi:hypothetical protein